MKRGIWLLQTSPLLFVCDGFKANLQKVFETRVQDRNAEETPTTCVIAIRIFVSAGSNARTFIYASKSF
jgi:hypothetical protein